MAEYTYEDVIIDPNDPRVEIGAEYWFGYNPSVLIKELNRGEEPDYGCLSDVDSDATYPFEAEDGCDWCCIIRKNEPSYEERQAEWVKANNIKVGDKVRITRKCESHENGWKNAWVSLMNSEVGKVLEITREPEKRGIFLGGEYFGGAYFPYFILEKVEEPEFKIGDFVKVEDGAIGVITDIIAPDFVVIRTNNLSYCQCSKSELEHIKAHLEPLDLSNKDMRERLKKEWIKREFDDGDCLRMIVGFQGSQNNWGVSLGGLSYPITAKEILKNWTFEDGSPCGIVVED